MAKKKRKPPSKNPKRTKSQAKLCEDKNVSAGLLDTAELTEDANNPRTITDKAAKGLGSSLDRFGDLSGIVWNRRTSELVAGHQRMAEIRKRWGDHPIQEIDQARGLYGIAVDDKHFFPVRVVDWSKAMQRAANVAANSQKIAGQFTDDVAIYLLEFQKDIEEEAPSLLDEVLLAELASEFEIDASPIEFGEHSLTEADITTIKFAFQNDDDRDSVAHAVEMMKSSGNFSGACIDGQSIATICRRYMKHK